MTRRVLIPRIGVIVAVVIAFVVVGFVVLDFNQIRRGAKQFVNTAFFLAGGPNLLRNGSFETGNFANTPDEPLSGGAQNCKLLCGGSAALDNWQVFSQDLPATQGCATAKDAVCWVQVPNGFQITTPDNSTRLVDLTGFAGRAPAHFGEVRQDVENTQPGASYELSFSIGTSSQFPPPQPPGKTAFYRIDVDVVGVPNGQMGFPAAPNTTDISRWERQTMRFNASGTTTTLIFSGTGSAPPGGHGGDYLGIDDVVLQRVCFFVDALLFGCQF